jgi:hypothetical protein
MPAESVGISGYRDLYVLLVHPPAWARRRKGDMEENVVKLLNPKGQLCLWPHDGYDV